MESRWTPLENWKDVYAFVGKSSVTDQFNDTVYYLQPWHAVGKWTRLVYHFYFSKLGYSEIETVPVSVTDISDISQPFILIFSRVSNERFEAMKVELEDRHLEYCTYIPKQSGRPVGVFYVG